MATPWVKEMPECKPAPALSGRKFVVRIFLPMALPWAELNRAFSAPFHNFVKHDFDLIINTLSLI